MKIKRIVKAIISNKIVGYMLTRYLTYGGSFIVALCIASKMGPYYYGIWGVLMLILNYCNIINWGIPQATQLFIIQNKNCRMERANYEKTGLRLICMITFLPIACLLYYWIGGFPVLHDNNFSTLYLMICVCAIINYFNLYYSKIYRSKNRIIEISFQQTSVVVLTAIMILFLEGRSLLIGIGISYFIAYFISLIIYCSRGGADFSGHYLPKYSKQIINKGILLFMYNSGFYLIIVSTKTMISMFYSVEEFGMFSFAYLLGYAVLQLLESFSFLLTSKLLDRFHSSNQMLVTSTISMIRISYVTLFHGVMYVAMIFFPLLLKFTPQYSDTIKVIYLCCVTMLLYTNSFGYSTFLIARNKEKALAIIVIFTLLLNVALGEVMIRGIHLGYEYIIIATMISYLYYGIMCVYYGRKEIGLPLQLSSVIKDCFPVELLIPFVCAVSLIVLGGSKWISIPFVLYVVLNAKLFRVILNSFKKLLFSPNIIDI